ncbi:MAG: hypothetical protein F6J93_15725 [Oscillatoria sp. SIO1A7]|nr:hypothetical protein [Oscillatoria sp. SIO1A7]
MANRLNLSAVSDRLCRGVGVGSRLPSVGQAGAYALTALLPANSHSLLPFSC